MLEAVAFIFFAAVIIGLAIVLADLYHGDDDDFDDYGW